MNKKESGSKKLPGAPFLLLLMINAFIYISNALYYPFLNAYYKSNGLNATQIGVLSTISPVCFILIQPLVTKLADRLGKPKAFTLAGTAGVVLSLASYYLGNSFWSFFISAALLAAFACPVYPLTDSMVIRNAARRNYNYAYIRLGGTIGYAISVILVSFVLSQQKQLLFFMGMAGYFVLFLLILFLPKEENRRPAAESENAGNSSSIGNGTGAGNRTSVGNGTGAGNGTEAGKGRADSRKPLRERLAERFSIGKLFTSNEVIFVLLYAFVFQLGAGFLYSFLSVYVVELGYDERAIGILQCVSATSEIPILLLVKRVEKKIPAIFLIGGATILMSLRLFMASGGTLVFFIIAQAMQGMTYMFVHFCTATYVAGHVRPGRASQGQGMIYFVQMGLAAILANLTGGLIIDALGSQMAYRLISAVVFGASALITAGLLMYRKKHPEAAEKH